MATITISRQYASNGNDIAEAIRQSAGYYLFDKHIVAEAAAEAGLSDEEIVDFSEANYKIKNFFDRLFGRSQVHIWKDMEDGERAPEIVNISEESALSLVKKAIQKSHQMGNTVIVGRGGQVILQNYPDVLHVRIEAPLEVRLQRVRNLPELAERSFMSHLDARRAALDLIEAHDSVSADYLKRFYGVDWSDPFLYHMVINTSKLSVDQAANLIIEAAQQLERETEYELAGV